MADLFSDDEIERLSKQIDAELMELHRDGRQASTKGEETPNRLPSRQREVLEKAVGENAEKFLDRFLEAAKRDLCEQGGTLFEQWKRWGDLSNKEVLKTFGTVLVAMGFSGGQLQLLVVAVAVIVLHVGVRAICGQ